MKLLEGYIAKRIGKAASKFFLDATLTRAGVTTGPDYDPTPGISINYPCKAITDEWGAYSKQNGLVAATDRKVLVLASTLAVTPQQGDRITFDGSTFAVYSDGSGQPAVSTDPAKAVWTLRCRG